ncbi:MAG: DNA integrity scanning protein DisA [Candidatus Hydrogenedentes bacterium]|nr:DNA integrity scanning protein DisA [Candidatus Hydrogenedentota bacterium]
MPKKIKTEEEALHEAIRMVAPGTPLREAIAYILQAGTGAMLCFGEPNRLARLSEGGVELNVEMRPQLLYELSKMDGSIILNEKGTRIYFANRFMKPNTRIPSEETGTRHRVAQRIASQAKCTVVTVSQRRASVTVFCHGRKYQMKTVQVQVNKAIQGIQTLERYVQTLQLALRELTMREMGDWVNLPDVCRVLQRAEMADRMFRREVYPAIEELGGEGRLFLLQTTELLKPLDEAKLVIKDYARERSADAVLERVHNLSDEDLLSFGMISQALGHGAGTRGFDQVLMPRGYRVLSMMSRFSDTIAKNLVERFGTLSALMRASKDQLVEVDGVGEVMAERLRTGLEWLRTQLNMDTRK